MIATTIDMKTAEQIFALYRSRRRQRGPAMARMEEIRDAYNGEIAIPMTELSSYEKAAVPNLVAQGIDQTATRIASTTPNILYPPTRPGIKKEEENARKRRAANLGWWEQNNMELKLRRRARWLQGYACAPVCVRPSALKQIPCWYVRDPLSTYPAPDADPDTVTPEDCIFSFRKTLSWVDHHYPNAILDLKRKRGTPPDTPIIIIEYMDANQITLIALSVALDPDRPTPDAAYPTYGTAFDDSWMNNQDMLVLENAINLAGICPAVIPGRITLDRESGQYDGIIGMYQAQAMLFALNFRAVAQDVWPNEWLISRPGENAEIITMADGRSGKIGKISGGDIKPTHLNPGYKADQLVSYLERNQRVTAGIPAEFGGESTGNVRTGRRGDSILSAVVDFPIQEAQTLLAKSLEAENRVAVAIDKAYYGNDPKSFYVNWRGARGNVDYTPNKIFTTDQNRVFFPAAGVDANNLTITLGQLVGTELMSIRTAMEMHPFIDDAEEEQERVIAQGLMKALETAIQQQAAAGSIPPMDIARITDLVLSNKMGLPEAVTTVQAESQARQASTAPAGSPPTQPGLGVPGDGSQVGAAIPPPTPSADNLAQVLSSVYPAAKGINRPNSGTSPNDRVIRR